MADHSADDSGAVRMRLLGSSRDLDGSDLPDLYGYPADHSGVWLRANFVASLDGGATFSGKSGQLGGPGDRAVFAALREMADVILVGAGTVRTEGYAGARPTVAQRQRRQSRGQSEVPQLAIVSKSGRLERDMPVFTRTEVPPLVCTCSAAADHDPTHTEPASPTWSTARSTTPTASTRPRCWPCWATAGCREC